MKNQLTFQWVVLFILLTIPGLTYGEWTLSPIDTLTTHAPGDTFFVDLRLGGSGPQIDAMGFDFYFPDSLIQPDSVLLAGRLLEPWMFKNVKRLQNNIYRIAGFTIGGAIQPATNGVLVSFRFVVQAQSRRTGIFSLSNLADDVATAITVPDTFHIFTNSNPQIISTPEIQAWEDALYTYQVTATDPDLDLLNFSLTRTPVWLTINATTGLIQGTPTNEQVGDTVVSVQVTDLFGGKALQDFSLTVNNVNDPPVIFSKPLFTATQHAPYFYQVKASDPDAGDVLQFALEIHPRWLQIEPDSGLVSGTPGTFDVGDTSVVVLVTDLAGASARQEFNLTIADVNDPPLIQSRPDTIAVEDSIYTYQIEAVDFDAADELTYLLEIAPTWLTIDAASGLVQGLPTNENVGDTLVSIKVHDKYAGESQQQFRLHVLNVNDPPVIFSTPLSSAAQHTPYFYQVEAVDPDAGDVLQFALEIHPHWLQIDPDSGLVWGTPGSFDVGDTAVVVLVTDLAGACARQEFNLTIADINDPPLIQSRPDTIAVEDSIYTYQIEAVDFDSDDTLTYHLAIAPTWLEIDSVSGLVQGLPTNENVGDTLVSIKVRDRYASESLQHFLLHVLNVNDIPGMPGALLKPAWQETTAVAEANFIWQSGTDPDVGDLLTYLLEVYEDDLLTLLKYQKAAIPDTFFAFSVIPNYATTFESGKIYYWRVQTIDQAGAVSAFTTPARFQFVGGGITDISGQNKIPQEYRLQALYPNPFNPSVTIPFELPRQSRVLIQIFNLQGQLLRTLVQEDRPAGIFQVLWDGRNTENQIVSSGIYLVRFQAGDFHALQKVTLIR